MDKTVTTFVTQGNNVKDTVMSKQSNLVIDTDDIIILVVPLAVLVGLNEALVLQQLHYWNIHNRIEKKKATHFFEGRWWVYNTWAEWQEDNFDCWGKNTIIRTFDRLCEKGLVYKREHEDRNSGNWFALGYEALNALQTGGSTQNGQPTGNTETTDDSTDSRSQNATAGDSTDSTPDNDGDISGQSPKAESADSTKNESASQIRNNGHKKQGDFVPYGGPIGGKRSESLEDDYTKEDGSSETERMLLSFLGLNALLFSKTDTKVLATLSDKSGLIKNG